MVKLQLVLRKLSIGDFLFCLVVEEHCGVLCGQFQDEIAPSGCEFVPETEVLQSEGRRYFGHFSLWCSLLWFSFVIYLFNFFIIFASTELQNA